MLSRVLGDDNASDEQSFIAERLDQTEYIDIVSDTEVIADFIFLDISGVDDNDDLSLVGKLLSGAKPGSTRDAW
mgnify:CR=1 FL=1